jgi:transposase InsO family protein
MKKTDKYLNEKEIIKEIFNENKKRYGYRRITMELRNRGIVLNHKTVQKLMKECGLICLIRRKKYRSYKGEIGKIAPNVLERNFYAEKPNQKWVTDVTEFAVNDKKVYLSPILDLYNGEIVSYNISLHPTFHQTMDMLEKAFNKIPDNANLILHSDQGWQYQMKRYQFMLKEKGIIQSMSRKGNCLDNSVMENFFGILKTEMFYGNRFNSVEQLIEEIEHYIDYYNNRRIKVKLKGLSPVQYRIQSLEVA